MPRYIDAENLKYAKCLFADNPYAKGWNDAIDAIVECEPTANVAEVVRCKDCKYHGATIEEQPTPSIMCAHMHDNDYCSYGKRREDGTVH